MTIGDYFLPSGCHQLLMNKYILQYIFKICISQCAVVVIKLSYFIMLSTTVRMSVQIKASNSCQINKELRHTHVSNLKLMEINQE